VTNTPIEFLAGIRTDPNRAEAAYQKLTDLKNNGELVSVVTTLRQYDNMVIESFRTQRDAANGNQLNCVLTLREVLIATTQPAEVPTPAEGVTNTTGPTERGEKPATAASEAETKAVDESVAFEFIGGIF